MTNLRRLVERYLEKGRKTGHSARDHKPMGHQQQPEQPALFG